MIVYHGSTEVVDSPRIIRTDKCRDFGIGFYTTDIKEQAIRWAQRKLLVAKRYYSADADYDWLDFVCACRSDNKYQHEYDIVTGKIADDNVGMTVSYVIDKIMRREDAIERLRFEEINNQICFCTEEALRYLKYVKSEKVSL